MTGSRKQAAELQSLLNSNYLPELEHVEFEGKEVIPPTTLPWYPNKFAYQIDVEKKVLRKSIPFRRFRDFLVCETAVTSLDKKLYQ